MSVSCSFSSYHVLMFCQQSSSIIQSDAQCLFNQTLTDFLITCLTNMHFLKKEARNTGKKIPLTGSTKQHPLIRLENKMPVFLSAINCWQIMARNHLSIVNATCSHAESLPSPRMPQCDICWDLFSCRAFLGLVSTKLIVSLQAIQKSMQTSGRQVNMEVINYDGQCLSETR